MGERRSNARVANPWLVASLLTMIGLLALAAATIWLARSQWWTLRASVHGHDVAVAVQGLAGTGMATADGGDTTTHIFFLGRTSVEVDANSLRFGDGRRVTIPKECQNVTIIKWRQGNMKILFDSVDALQDSPGPNEPPARE